MRVPCTNGSEANNYRNEETLRANEGHRKNCERATINCSNGTGNSIAVIEQNTGVQCFTTNNVGSDTSF